MMQKWHTESFLVFWFLVLGAYAFVAARYYPEASISDVMNDTVRTHPLLGVLFGMMIGLCAGHFFWPLSK